MKKANYKAYVKLCLIWLVAVVTSACVEEIETDSFTYEKLLTVSANISDQVKAHEVRLSYTIPVDGNLDNPSNKATGAMVWVEDDLGTRTDFIEQGPGLYISPATFAGEAGRKYALFIITSEGKRYQSSFEELVAAPEVSKIYHRFSFVTPDQSAIQLPGLQFFIDVENAGQSTQFYRYEISDTHQVKVPYPKQWQYIRNGNAPGIIIPFNEDVEECYREQSYNDLVLATSTINENSELKEVPVKFVAASQLDVTTFYSLEVTQRAISAEAYSYYRKLELFNESNGTLFDKQQGTLTGNVVSIDSPDEKVLGYFEVSGANSTRMFLGTYDFDRRIFQYINSTCGRYSPIEYDGTMEAFYLAQDLPLSERAEEIAIRSVYDLYYFDQNSERKYLAHRLCTDCTRSGSPIKPDYWP